MHAMLRYKWLYLKHLCSTQFHVPGTCYLVNQTHFLKKRDTLVNYICKLHSSGISNNALEYLLQHVQTQWGVKLKYFYSSCGSRKYVLAFSHHLQDITGSCTDANSSEMCCVTCYNLIWLHYIVWRDIACMHNFLFFYVKVALACEVAYSWKLVHLLVPQANVVGLVHRPSHHQFLITLSCKWWNAQLWKGLAMM